MHYIPDEAPTPIEIIKEILHEPGADIPDEGDERNPTDSPVKEDDNA